MIEKIRKPEKTRNIATYITSIVIFGMIVATFVFMIPGMTGPTGAVNTAAEVGKSTVSLREYNDQLRMVRSQYQRMFNGEIPPFFEANLKGQVLESLVQNEVMRQFAKEQGVIVSDIEVADFLKKEIPAFQEDGQFSLSNYNRYLESVRLTPAKFEKRVYNDLLRQKLQSVFSLAFQKTDLEESLIDEGEGLKMKFKFIKYDPSLVASSTKVSSVEVENFISTPEGLDEVKSFFDSNKADYSSEKEVKLSYILIDSESKAQELKKILTPDNFADRAKSESQDKLSKDKGGEVGFIKKGEFDESIESVVFGMSAGQISEPIKTDKGFAIAYVTEVKEATTLDFDENKKEVALDFLKDKAVKLAQDKVNELSKEGRSEELKAFLLNSGHKWSKTQEFGLTDPSVPGIGDAKEVFPKLISLSPGESSSKLAFVGSDRFIFMNEGFIEKNDTTNEENTPLPKNISDTRGQEAYFLVYQNEKEKKKIVINDELVAN
jgi:peptidyl-prolyl cis-trans isomerase D